MLGTKIYSQYIDNNTGSYSFDSKKYGYSLYFIMSNHFSHGSCGGLYYYFLGANTGGKLVTLESSSHCFITVDNKNNILTFSSDTWGCFLTIYAI